MTNFVETGWFNLIILRIDVILRILIGKMAHKQWEIVNSKYEYELK